MVKNLVHGSNGHVPSDATTTKCEEGKHGS
jgi:hypothetical protein